MSNLMPEQAVEMRVADSGRAISFLFTKGNRKEVRDLTGYSGWVSFWYTGATTPHVARAGVVTAASGLLTYTLLGDEFTTAGECMAQATVAPVDWYLGSAPGRGGHMVSADVVKFVVKARPS